MGPCIAKLDGGAKPAAGFGKDGVACLVSPIFGDAGILMDVLPLDDGSVIAAGIAGTIQSMDVLVVKVTASGELDGSFGAGGITRWTMTGSSEVPQQTLIDSEGRVLVAGFTVADATSVTKPFVIRLDKSGQPDPWFGKSGIVVLERNVPVAAAMGMTFGPNAEIYLSGTEASQPAIYALEPEKGALLASFGQGGARVYPDLGAGRFASLVWDEGKLLVSGTLKIAGVDTAITARMASNDGGLDSAFAQAGVMALPVGALAPALATAPSSRAVVLVHTPGGYTIARAWR
jgi:uncharacterized delta-60 repeat protein